MRTNFMPRQLHNPLLAIGGILSGIGAIGKFASGIKQSKESKKINPIWQQYKTNPFAQQQLGAAQNAYGGRMAGAGSLENNIFANQGAFMGNVNRNATDSSQALALAAGGQQQTNDALANLQIQEAQNKYSMLNNLNQAYGTMIGEGDKEYNSILQKYQIDAQRKDALANAGAQNKFGAVSDLAGMAFMGSQAGLGKNWFNGWGKKQQTTPIYSDYSGGL
jgi:hypothetical protein